MRQRVYTQKIMVVRTLLFFQGPSDLVKNVKVKLNVYHKNSYIEKHIVAIIKDIHNVKYMY